MKGSKFAGTPRGLHEKRRREQQIPSETPHQGGERTTRQAHGNEEPLSHEHEKAWQHNTITGTRPWSRARGQLAAEPKPQIDEENQGEETPRTSDKPAQSCSRRENTARAPTDRADALEAGHPDERYKAMSHETELAKLRQPKHADSQTDGRQREKHRHERSRLSRHEKPSWRQDTRLERQATSDPTNSVRRIGRKGRASRASR